MTSGEVCWCWRVLVVAALLCAGVWVFGCEGSSRNRLRAPEVLVSPYSSVEGDALWAVAPVLNESGTGEVDGFAVADAFVAAITAARGMSAVPVNRVAAGMEGMKMRAVSSPAEARALATALGVDGVLVVSVTAWDPYDPPVIGMTAALFMNDRREGMGVDPTALTRAYTDQGGAKGYEFSERPSVVVSEHLDASNHEVRLEVERYARGRHDEETALGAWRYTASMELYTRFAAHQVVRRLLDEERLRLARGGAGMEDEGR